MINNIISKLTTMVFDEDYEFRKIAAKTLKNENLEALRFKNKSTYVNPCSLRLR